MIIKDYRLHSVCFDLLRVFGETAAFLNCFLCLVHCELLEGARSSIW